MESSLLFILLQFTPIGVNCTSLLLFFNPHLYFALTIKTSTFYKCTSLKSIDIPESVTKIEDSAFNNCTSLEKIVIPENVTFIGNNVFYQCSALASVSIPHSVQSIGINAFYQCNSLTEVYIPEGVKTIGSSAFYNCKNLEKVEISDTVTNISSSAFQKCESLTDVTLGNGIKKIESSVFRGCAKLPEIVIPDGVTEIGDYAFAENVKLAKVVIPASVTKISATSAFSYPKKMTFYGYAGSTAETYATEKKITFIDITGDKIDVISQPTDVTAKVSDTVDFEYVVSGTDLKYQWFAKKSDAQYWDKLDDESAVTSKFTFTAENDDADTQYYCRIINGNGIRSKSDVVNLKLSGAVEAGTFELTVPSLNAGTDYIMTLTPSDGSVPIVLESSTDEGGNVTFSVEAPAGTYELRITAPGYTTYTDKSFVLGTDKLPETIEIYAGDINGDNIINAKDSAILSAAFGTRKGSDGFNSNADLNGDGIINAKDKAILSANFTRRSVEVA